MRWIQQRFVPHPVTLVAVMFAAVLVVAQATPAAAQQVRPTPTRTPVRATATPYRPAPTRAPARPAATAQPAAPAPARPAAPSMPRAGGGGMATRFVDDGNGGQGLWFGVVSLAVVGSAGVLYARRLRIANARVLLH